jgi:hypothetical protein
MDKELARMETMTPYRILVGKPKGKETVRKT